MKPAALVLVWCAAVPALRAQTLEQRLQHKLDSLVQAGRIVGVTAGIALADGRVIALAAGQSDTAQDRAMRPTDRMMAGSVGKMFFSALALRLVQEGRLDLDAPIARYLAREPWLDSLPNGRTATIRQIMNHTSGLVRYELNPRFLADLQAQPDRAFTPVEELRYLFGSPAPFAAGQGWDYSDTNYIVLAYICEQILGRRAYDEIRRRVIEPLGLRNTVPSDRREIPGLVQGYAGSQNPFGPFDAVLQQGRFAVNPQFEWAGGGYASTGEDLARFAKAWYEGRFFDTSLVREAIASGVEARQLGGNARYGLTVIIRQTPNGTTWGHSGFFPGYLTEVRYFPERRVAIAVQLNQNQPGRGPAQIANDLAGVLFAEGAPAR